MATDKNTQSPEMGATETLGAGVSADTQPQSVVHEIKTWDNRFQGYDYGRWGVEFKSENEIVIHNDNIAHFYGFSTIFVNRCEIKFYKKVVKVKHVGSNFQQTGMYIYESEDNYIIHDANAVKQFISLFVKFATEKKSEGYSTIYEAFLAFLRDKKTPNFPELEKKAIQEQLEEEWIELEND